MTDRSFAFGKVILLGEHAVVFGHPAIAAGIDRGVYARAFGVVGAASTLRVSPWGTDFVANQASENPVERALFHAVEGVCRDPRAFAIDANVEIAHGAGLGCSAALGVAVLRAIAHEANVVLTDQRLTELSHAWETHFHGTPSGIDNATAMRGGVSRFTRASGLTPLALANSLHVVVGNSNSPSSTHATVAMVRERHSHDPNSVDKIFRMIAEFVDHAEHAMITGDVMTLGNLLNRNHEALQALELSTTRLDAMCETARRAGALGAKLTGGGGGGCMIALAANAHAARSIAVELGADAFHAEIRR